MHKIQVAIVDYGLGNLFSVKQACEHVGMQARITNVGKELAAADAVILPGVGAYGDAMAALKRLDLVSPLQEIARSDQWLVGICLGLQLLMTESFEFGHHLGLDIIPGQVLPLENPRGSFLGEQVGLKVPQVGWNRVWQVPAKERQGPSGADTWEETPLKGLQDGEFMYFVHSYYVKPDKDDWVTSTSTYGHIEFCSALQYNNTFACQFHPERSGSQGLKVYQNLVDILTMNGSKHP